MSARFDRLDRNGDGFLSRDEIPALGGGGPAAKAVPAPARGSRKPAAVP